MKQQFKADHQVIINYDDPLLHYCMLHNSTQDNEDEEV